MSGTSYDAPCPVCSGSMNCYSDWKPYDSVSGECYDCGFYFFTELRMASKKGLKQMRMMDGMRKTKHYSQKEKNSMLKKLEDVWGYKIKRDR